jgi:MFS family permease
MSENAPIQYELKRIKPVTLGKVIALWSALIGFIVGLIVGFVMFVIGEFITDVSGWGPLLGIGGFLIVPLIFAALGFIFGVVAAFLYNFFARHSGGIILELEEKCTSEGSLS